MGIYVSVSLRDSGSTGNVGVVLSGRVAHFSHRSTTTGVCSGSRVHVVALSAESCTVK